MNYWLIRTDAPSVASGREGTSFTLKTRRKPRISVSDFVIFLENSPEPEFKRYGQVSEVESHHERTFEPNQTELQFTKVSVKEIHAFPEDLELDDMRYSLTFVRNTSLPSVHFRRGYRRISEEDFETLKSGKPFVARTGYFELLKALPLELQSEFRAELMLDYQLRDKHSYTLLFEKLTTFVAHRVLSVGNLLAELQQIVEELDVRNENGFRVRHVFAEDDESFPGIRSRSDELAEQNRRFSDLRNDTSQEDWNSNTNPFHQILEGLEDDSLRRSEQRFVSIFKGEI